MSVQITVNGNSVKDVANRMRELADEMYKPKSLKAEIEEDEEDEVEEEDTEEDVDDSDEAEEEAEEDDDEDSEDEEDVEEAPKKTAKKAKKLTNSDVNDACKKLASSIGGKEGRKKVLSILKKKFKTESVSELKPTDYAKCIEAMADAK